MFSKYIFYFLSACYGVFNIHMSWQIQYKYLFLHVTYEICLKNYEYV